MGPQGAQGAASTVAGPQGATGAQGATGSQGATGTVGGTGQITQSAATVNCTGNCNVTVTCTGTLKVTGGGLKVVSTSGTGNAQNMHMSQSYPSADNAWTVYGTNVGGGTITVAAYAICVQ